MARSFFVLVVLTACQRTDPAVTTTTAASSSAIVVAPPAVLTPLATTSAPLVASSAPLAPAPPPPRLVASVRAAPATKRDPMKVCCDALRKETQVQFAQAASMCDGIVSALDQTGNAPQLETMLKPILADAPLPKACKGL